MGMIEESSSQISNIISLIDDIAFQTNLLALKGFKIDLWVFEKEVKDQIESYRENKFFLPGVSLSDHICPFNDIEAVVKGKDLVLLVVPSHVMRETASKIRDHISTETIIVSASKGIENKTHLTMSGVLKEIFHDISEDSFAVLSGPSFAREVVRKVPTVVAVAARNQKVAGFVQHIFATPYFRVYTNNDMVGVELGGSVKNVIAIAAGIIDGLGDDYPIWANKVHKHRPVFCKEDTTLVTFRKWVRQFYLTSQDKKEIA